MVGIHIGDSYSPGAVALGGQHLFELLHDLQRLLVGAFVEELVRLIDGRLHLGVEFRRHAQGLGRGRELLVDQLLHVGQRLLTGGDEVAGVAGRLHVRDHFREVPVATDEVAHLLAEQVCRGHLQQTGRLVVVRLIGLGEVHRLVELLLQLGDDDEAGEALLRRDERPAGVLVGLAGGVTQLGLEDSDGLLKVEHVVDGDGLRDGHGRHSSKILLIAYIHQRGNVSV